MSARRLALALSGLALAASNFAAHAEVRFANLGASAPPATIGGHAMTPFDPPPFLDSYTFPVQAIPGPGLTQLLVTPAVYKATATVTWNSSWSHYYAGAVYFSGYGISSTTLWLPPNTRAFYLYAQPNNYGAFSMTVSTDSGATSGPTPVNMGQLAPNDGATGFAFYATAGESITSITVSSAAGSAGFAFGEFGINMASAATACASAGYIGTKLEWCKNICERGYTGATLDIWIRRWIDRYRQLPYCAAD